MTHPPIHTSKLGSSAAALAVCAALVASLASCGTSPSGQAPTQTSATAASDQATEQVSPMERTFLIPASQDEDDAIAPSVTPYEIEPELSNVTNATDLYLSPEEQEALRRYGFVVNANIGHYEFYEQYESNRYNQLPNFVTTDSLMHTYHLYFQHLQKNTEREGLAPAIRALSEQLLQTSEEQLEALAGTEWEDAARTNVAFFAVACALQDPTAPIPDTVAEQVSGELKNIMAASGEARSAVTGDVEDYTQYAPRGYYEGDEVLESYFRTMMWYGRMNFTQSSEELDRSALLITLALKDDVLSAWECVYTVTSFFAGASDDNGYYEYRPAVEAAYGTDATIDDLPSNDEGWQTFHALTAQMEAPQINSVPLGSNDDPEASRTEDEKGFRLMGQRFTLDEMIFQQLVYPQVKANGQDEIRTMPDALDVPAALGSQEAYQILEEQGATSYPRYDDNLSALQEALADETDIRWSASLYSQWLHTLNPLLEEKGEGYPTFMRSSQWMRKSLQSYLGSFTELKHDTVLYSKQIMVEMGGGAFEDRDDRGYVEPEPEVFGRLSALSAATAEGLVRFGLLGEEDADNLELLRELAQGLATIARKELVEEAPTDEEYELIRSYGGQLEHFWQEVYKNESSQDYITGREFPAAVVADVATSAESGTVLELGTGNVNTIYVVVPVDGKLRIATGAVFSFYEFEQPMQERLTDTAWREMMGIELTAGATYNEPAQQLESWTNDFTIDDSQQ